MRFRLQQRQLNQKRTVPSPRLLCDRVFARLVPPEMRDIHDTTLLGVVRVDINNANADNPKPSSRQPDFLGEIGYLYSTKANQQQSILEVRLLSRESFDLKFATDRLAYCLENHRLTCVIERSPLEILEFLRVIDCQTRTIIQAQSECQYVALSYVWGCPTSPTTSTVNQNIQPTLHTAPKVINDAIEVTLKLRLRYLWVDRYCINQSNKDKKLNQIRLMDLIYANARLTIIAAAGENPDYGLPGVRGTFRNSQPSLKVTHFMVSTLPHPRWSVGHSKWASRGWTYQEGLLSKRRLVFTNEQALYECNGMNCVESLILPLNKLHIKSTKAFKENTPKGSFMHKTPGKKPWQVMSYIAEFSKRDLSFPKDAINAMQGIFNTFSHSRRPVYQFIGVPILPPEAALNEQTLYRRTDRSPEECFLIGLSWYHIEPGGQRQNFPSWSWAGWFGELSSHLKFSPESFSRLNNAKVWIEDDDGSQLSFPVYESLPPFLSRDYCKNRFIHIEAITVQSSVVYLERDPIVSATRENYRWWIGGSHCMKKDRYYARFQADKDMFVYAKVYLDRREQDFRQTFLEGRVLTGILVGEQSSYGFVLVVQEMGKYAERLGCFKFWEFETLRYKKNEWNQWESLVNERQILDKWLEEMPKVRQKIRLG